MPEFNQTHSISAVRMTCSGGAVLQSAEVNMGVWGIETQYCHDGFSRLQYKLEEGPVLFKGFGSVRFVFLLFSDLNGTM